MFVAFYTVYLYTCFYELFHILLPLLHLWIHVMYVCIYKFSSYPHSKLYWTLSYQCGYLEFSTLFMKNKYYLNKKYKTFK
jgi:hypothetical protein